MNLDTYATPADLYLARGEEVNPNRPIFTGDVYRDLPIAGVQDSGMALVLAHPCSFRFGAELADRLLVARVVSHPKQGPGAWRRGFLDRMPLPELDGDGFWAGYLELLGRTPTSGLRSGERVACLSEFGINMLQQRLTCHLTRAEVPTAKFNEAFAHTYNEADLLEEWTDTLTDAGWTPEAAAVKFEAYMRAGDPSPQAKLLDVQQRPAVRRACRQQAALLAQSAPEGT